MLIILGWGWDLNAALGAEVMVVWESHTKHLPCCGDSLSFPVTFVYSWFASAYEICICILHPCVFTVLCHHKNRSCLFLITPLVCHIDSYR